MENLESTDKPKILLPHFLKNLNENSKYGGTSQMLRVGRHFIGGDTNDPKYSVENNWNFYHNSIQTLDKRGDIEWIKSISTRFIGNNPTHEIFTNPKVRFEENYPMVVGTVNCASLQDKNWQYENKFTSNVLPLVHYLKAKEIYNLGFDNQGGRINNDLLEKINPKNLSNQFHNDRSTINIALEKFKLWVNWEPHHKMKIYSVAEDKYTPNNTILRYKPLETLLNG